MSESFNRRFALEQAVLLHARTDTPVLSGTADHTARTAGIFLAFLEADK